MERSILIGALLLSGVAGLLSAGCGPTSYLITPVPATHGLRESVVRRESWLATRKVAVIDVDGMLVNGRRRSLVGLEGENPVALFKEKLDKAARDRAVAAVVLRINSPGGTVTASDIMYAELQRFKARTKRPTVTCMLDTAASGGYYLACATDHIVAHPTTITGSIGVIMLLPNIADTLGKIGAAVHAVKSGEFKDMGSPFRPLGEADRALYQTLVDEMYERFLAIVRHGRPKLPPERIAELADGRVLLGSEAQRLGLVDETGTLTTALAAAKRLAGLAEQPVLVVQYARPYAHVPNVYAADGGPAPRATAPADLLPPWLAHSTPTMLYLWAPGW